VITPYKPDGWTLALSSTGLTHKFPNLVHDITYGTPIGNPPPLMHTFIPDNLKLANINPTYMDTFIQEELDAGRFNGPFTIQEAHLIFGSHFHTAPLGFIEKPGSTVLRLIHHHSKEDGLSQSTNGWLDPSMDATRFYMAADATDFMSLTFWPLFFPIYTTCFKNSCILYHNELLYIAFFYAMEAQDFFPVCKHPSPGDWP